MERSIEFYRNVLGYNRIQSDHTSRVAEYGGAEYRRVLLRTEHPRRGAFSRLLGDTEIELVYRIDNTAKQIFKNRYWGDLGFIHVCFDVNDMQALKASCMQHNAAFTVDSAESFDMGAAAGHFAYIEDPDGTLIEFVQTHKLPIMKKLNWYLDLRKRASMKPLPDWMLGAMRFSRVKG
jgi:catechol 2,3-dioxygenase-like lactoylglutathione lyase family enzyme